MFGGIYFRNTLPPVHTIYSRPTVFICNTAKDTHITGTHWIAILKGVSIPEYFDSLGKYPHGDIVKFLGPTFMYCTLKLQDIALPSCGHYVLYYVACRAQGLSFQQTLEIMYALGDQAIIEAVSPRLIASGAS